MRREATFVLVAGALFLLSAACDVEARTWYINEAGTGDAPTINAAMDSAAYGDTVLVGPGTYVERVMMTDGVTLKSELGPTQTVLTYPYYAAVYFGSWVTSGALVGFTVTGTEYQAGYWGAVTCWEADGVVIRGNLVVNNMNCGIVVFDSAAEVVGNTVVNNQYHGIHCEFGRPRNIRGNLCVGNSGGIVSDESWGLIECNDSWGNGGEYYLDQYLDPSNISEDPLFCDYETGDFTLNSCSPCLPGNHPGGYDCGLIGAFGQGCDSPSGVEADDTWGTIKALFR